MVPTVRLTFADGGGEADRFPGIQCLPAHHDQLLIERLVQARGPGVKLQYRSWFMNADSGLVQHGCQIQPVGLPVRPAPAWCPARPACPTALVEGAEAQLRHILPHFFGDEHEEVLHELRLTGETVSRSTGFWVATPTGQVSKWHTRIMMQPATTSGAVGENRTPRHRAVAATITSRPVLS